MIQRSNDLPHYAEYPRLVSLAEEQMRLEHPCGCMLMSLDFDNFNYINDLFGYDVGTEALCLFEAHLSRSLEPGEYFCHLHADQYLLWLRKDADEERTKMLTDLRLVMEHLLPTHYNLVCSGGTAWADDSGEVFTNLMDKANFARKRAKGNYASTVLTFDTEMSTDLQWRKTITLMMDTALREREFEMYLQPKVIITTGQIAGAEALVRWNNATYGLIYPDRFIPIMEQNGFIRHLDFFMLASACRYLRSAAESGDPLLPISVNFSKAHLRDQNFVEQVFNIVTHHGISTRLIEIEFTENMFTDDFQALVDVAAALKCLGFRIALDDFGSAYSSLNCLKDLPLDVIKIDKSFFDETTDTDKGKAIIAKMVELIKSLRLVSVMEGIETAEQAQFLEHLSCDMGQGYFYARPMPVSAYVAYLRQGQPLTGGEDVEAGMEQERMYAIPQEFQMDNWELYTLGKNIDIGLMKGYLDGEATVQYVNDKALEYLGCTRQEFREVFRNRVTAFTHPDDVPLLLQNIQELIRTGKPYSFRNRAIRMDGKIIFLAGRASCVADNQGRPIGLYAFQDVTEELERSEQFQQSMQAQIAELESAVEALYVSEERYRLIMEQSNDIMFDWDFKTDTITFSDRFPKQFGRDPICTDITTNPGIRNIIHAADLDTFEGWIQRVYKKPDCVQAEFRIQTAAGNYLWMRCRSCPVCGPGGAPIRSVGVFTNIDSSKQEIEKLTQKAQLDPLTKLYHKEETRVRIETWLRDHPGFPAALFIIDADNFKEINDNLGHPTGDVTLIRMAERVRRLFRESDIVGRIGGDEILVFAVGLVGDEEVARRARVLVDTIRDVCLVPSSESVLSVSVGVACCPEHGETFEILYQLADKALYQAKHGGRGRCVVFQGGGQRH